MLPHDPEEIDAQTWRWLWAVFAVFVLVAILACAVFAPPALVFARSTRRPVLRVGCYQAVTFKREWRIVR